MRGTLRLLSEPIEFARELAGLLLQLLLAGLLLSALRCAVVGLFRHLPIQLILAAGELFGLLGHLGAWLALLLLGLGRLPQLLGGPFAGLLCLRQVAGLRLVRRLLGGLLRLLCLAGGFTYLLCGRGAGLFRFRLLRLLSSLAGKLLCSPRDCTLLLGQLAKRVIARLVLRTLRLGDTLERFAEVLLLAGQLASLVRLLGTRQTGGLRVLLLAALGLSVILGHLLCDLLRLVGRLLKLLLGLSGCAGTLQRLLRLLHLLDGFLLLLGRRGVLRLELVEVAGDLFLLACRFLRRRGRLFGFVGVLRLLRQFLLLLGEVGGLGDIVLAGRAVHLLRQLIQLASGFLHLLRSFRCPRLLLKSLSRLLRRLRCLGLPPRCLRSIESLGLLRDLLLLLLQSLLLLRCGVRILLHFGRGLRQIGLLLSQLAGQLVGRLLAAECLLQALHLALHGLLRCLDILRPRLLEIGERLPGGLGSFLLTRFLVRCIEFCKCLGHFGLLLR